MTVLILCNKDDQVAFSLFRQLENTVDPALLVTAEDLVTSGWKQLLGPTGECSTEITLPDSKVIHSASLKAVFNRIRYLPMPHFLNNTDRQYAEIEILALFSSFLQNIQQRLINPIQTRYLIPAEDNDLLIKTQAIQAGLPICNYHFTSAPRWQNTKGMVPMDPNKSAATAFYKKSPHLVWENQPVLFTEAYNKVMKAILVGEDIFGEVPSNHVKALKKLSAITGIPFLEIYLVHTAAGYKLGQVNRFPLFADPPVIDALARLMLQKINQFA